MCYWCESKNKEFITLKPWLLCKKAENEVNKFFNCVQEEPKKGLYNKFTVINNETGEEVKDCFVLRPEIDYAARQALETYALCTPNKELMVDIYNWLNNIRDKIEKDYDTGE